MELVRGRTVYTRAMRGVRYNMQTINSYTYTDYTMTSFQFRSKSSVELRYDKRLFYMWIYIPFKKMNLNC